MGCLTEKLAANILKDCDNLSVIGIETDVQIIPLSDIDRTATTFDASNRLLVTNLALKAGKTAYKLEGVKQLNGYNWEFVPGDDQTLDKYRHVFSGVIVTPSVENRLSASNLAAGEAYAIVVNKKYKGADSDDAFLLLGYYNGLYVTEMTENSRESDANILFTLSSKDTSLEFEAPRVVKEGDYDTTLTAFNNGFAA